MLAGTRFGGYQSRVVVGEDDIVPLPERLSFEQGAAIPVNYATAWAGLVRYGGLQAGERVLLQAAAGGVGIAAIQLASASARRSTAPPRRASTRRCAPRERWRWLSAARPAQVRPDHGRGRRPLVPRSYDLLNPGGR